MGVSLAPDASSIDSLTGVATAISKLDTFYCLLASSLYDNVPDPGLLEIMPGWQTVINCWSCGLIWYGTLTASGFVEQEGCKQRGEVFDGMFDAFDPQDADLNWVEPLSKLSELQSEIARTGWVVSVDQITRSQQNLTQLCDWMDQKTTAFDKSFVNLQGVFRNVQAIHDKLTEVSKLPEAEWQSPYRSINASIIAMAEALSAPEDALQLAWKSIQTLMSGIAHKVATARSADVSLVLQSLDIAASLKEWPELCEMVQSYRPGPPPPIQNQPPRSC